VKSRDGRKKVSEVLAEAKKMHTFAPRFERSSSYKRVRSGSLKEGLAKKNFKIFFTNTC
jgi:hypothetical protein